jgi:hypothetical protein
MGIRLKTTQGDSHPHLFYQGQTQGQIVFDRTI